ncbi:MAG: CHC2 zinc finger domain-containing protein [Steroidobacteraceae bacterium]
MARIPQVELERLRSEISVERLVEAAGIALKPAGKDLLGHCPFHEDREASLVVTPAKNLWHCFACQVGGGPIDWVMKTKGVSFRHAVELLREGAASGMGEAVSVPIKRSTVPKLAPPVRLDADDQALLAQAIEYYHERLKGSPEALAYLERRGLRDETMIERFKLGFADRTLGLRLPEKNRKAGAEIRGRLQKVGLWRASGHEHFNGSIVIPVIAPSGEITEVYGRKINDNLREGTPYHLYLPGPHRGVWNELALETHQEVILCEALIDALTFWCAGFHNVTAAYGVEGFTADHLSVFKLHGIERVLIAYDHDEAGDRAAEKLSQRLLAEGLDCYRILFPHGMDANEYALKVQPASKSLGLVIRKAQWLGKGAAKPISTTGPVAARETVSLLPKVQTVPVAWVPESESVAISEPIPAPPTAAALDLAAKPMLPELVPVPHAVLPSSPVPPLPAAGPRAEVQGEEVVMGLGDRRYRVRGLKKNLAFDVMLRVNVMVSKGEAFHVDTLDLYSVRARGSFITQASSELSIHEDIIRHDLGSLLRELEALQERTVAETLTPQAAVTVAPEESEEALALLKDPKLLGHILADFAHCGVVGEETNKLIGYLAATSRKLESPLAVMVQSSSAAGKSSLMEAVLAFMPEEDKVQYSAMTGQSLFYMGGRDLKHKILALAEEEGAARASYALKLLQSEGTLSIASTGKDPESGKLVTQEYRVEGPVMIFSTTTAIDHDEELLNRCLTLAVDESREQTRAIHRLQREKRTLEGLFARRSRERILRQHRNAQRLLRPLAVRNPYADRLTFPDERTRLRRDHEKYLTLIDTIALLHQHQRVIKTAEQDGEHLEYVEVTLDDIEVANRLAHEALGRSLDELSPQTRRLLDLVSAMVDAVCTAQQISRAEHRFTRRDAREYCGWSDFQVKMHMRKLEELEYVLVHRGGRGQSFVYELLYDGGGQDGKPHLTGLIDVAALRACHYDGQQEHENARLEPPRSPQGVGKEPGSCGAKSAPNAVNPSTCGLTPRKNGSLASLEDASLVASYPPPLAASSV